jgi:hypothetical protein
VAIGCYAPPQPPLPRGAWFPSIQLSGHFLNVNCYDAAFTFGCTKPGSPSVLCRTVGTANQGQVRAKAFPHPPDYLSLQLSSPILTTINHDSHFFTTLQRHVYAQEW